MERHYRKHLHTNISRATLVCFLIWNWPLSLPLHDNWYFVTVLSCYRWCYFVRLCSNPPKGNAQVMRTPSLTESPK
uniref:Putative secreted peptide n=1 Tax=Anopheles braziliensis TaxID=58242 RepID=A0A2M3ZRN6_9DIPT